MERIVGRFDIGFIGLMSGDISSIVDAEKFAEFGVLHLVTSFVLEGGEIDIDARCALFLRELGYAGDMVGIATIHREEVVDILLIHLDADFAGAPAIIRGRHFDAREERGEDIDGLIALFLRVAYLHAYEVAECLSQFGIVARSNTQVTSLYLEVNGGIHFLWCKERQPELLVLLVFGGRIGDAILQLFEYTHEDALVHEGEVACHLSIDFWIVDPFLVAEFADDAIVRLDELLHLISFLCHSYEDLPLK